MLLTNNLDVLKAIEIFGEFTVVNDMVSGLKLDKIDFAVMMCMLIEEWSLEHEDDAVSVAQAIADNVKGVNEEEGKYGSEYER